MKKKALATKMAAFVMAGAMTMSMGGFTAFAVDTPAAAPTLTKKVTTNGKTHAPNTTFEFEVKPTNNVYEETAIDKNGIPGGLTLKNEGKIIFVPGTLKTDYTNNTEFEIHRELFQSRPGRYHYVITEKTGNYEGIHYSQESKEVIVYVYAYTDPQTKATSLKYALTGLGAENTKLTNIEFTNEYGSSENEKEVQKLEIVKKVEGTFSSLDDEFELTIKVDQQKETGTHGEYELYYAEKNGDVANPITLQSGSAQTVTIKGNENIIIYGLTKGDVVSVTETNTKGYTPKYEISGSVARTSASDNDPFVGSVIVTDNDDNGKLTITNTRDAATPTGIVTEYAPYILLVAAAGAFAVLFLRRKKEEF